VQKLNEVPGFKAYTPPAAFYVMVNVTKAMEMLGLKRGDLEGFRRMILKESGVSFCTREHFGAALPEEREQYVRYFSSAHSPFLCLFLSSSPSPFSLLSSLLPRTFLTILQICVFWNRLQSDSRSHGRTQSLYGKAPYIWACFSVVWRVNKYATNFYAPM
jgi:hypothetical protein